MCGTTNTNLFAKITFLKNIPQLGVEAINALIPGGAAWVTFCGVGAAGFSEPLLHYSPFYGQI